MKPVNPSNANTAFSKSSDLSTYLHRIAVTSSVVIYLSDIYSLNALYISEISSSFLLSLSLLLIPPVLSLPQASFNISAVTEYCKSSDMTDLISLTKP